MLLLFISPSSVLKAEGPAVTLKVTEIVVARGVENLIPVSPGESFPAFVERLYCFTRVEGAQGDTFVRHLWFYGERLMAEVTLPVGSTSWRTYSSKRIIPSWKGQWRVDITTEDGLLLKSVQFRVE